MRMQTIWSEIQARFPKEEHYEVKSLIGFNLVEEVEEIVAEIESFSTLALLSFDSGNLVVEHFKHFTELTDSVIAEIEWFVGCFRIKSSCTQKSHSEKDQSDITSLCEIDVENGFRDHSHSLDKIRHLISIELQLMKKKLGNLQTMVLSSLTGSVQTKIITSEEKLKTVSELTWVNQGENEDDLDSKVNASRILSSRLNHRCERCTPRRRVGSELSSTTCSSIRDQMQKELTSLSLDSVSDNESDPETPISGKWEKEDVVDKKLRELLTMQRCGKEDTQLSASEIPLCGILQTLSPTANVQRPLPTSSMITTAASSFNRIPSLRRLHPLKLRPMVKTSGKLGHSKEVRHGVGNGRKSPVTALPGRRISDFESGRTSANGHPHTPRKTSIPRHPPPPRADLAKKASLSMARKVA